MSQVIVDICSSALIKLGAEPINALTDDTKEARLCNHQFERLRDAVLRSAPWSFALKRIELAPIAETLMFSDLNQFQLPTDCVKFVRLVDRNTRYSIEGRRLISPDETLQGWYVSNAITPNEYDPNFSEALAYAIAADLCYSITQSTSLKQSLTEGLEFWIGQARSYNSQEVTPEDFIFDEFLNSRRGGYAVYDESDIF